MSEQRIDPISEGIALECASDVRGCCTDEQYQRLVQRIAQAIQAERDDHEATLKHSNGCIFPYCEEIP